MDAAAPPERFAAWSSSGGKDSMLALLRARAAGLEVRTMLSMFDETGARNRSHGIPRALVEAQARALGLELEGPSASWSDYEATFVRALQGLRERGAGSVVFGDIDLQPHRDWEEKVCAAAGLEARLPLWGEGRRALAEEVLRAGIRAVVVCVDSRYLDDSFCGREFDEQFLKDLPASVCPCGENGEFHTFVTDSPLMSAPLRVRVQGFRTYVSPPEFGAQRYQFADLAMTGDAAPVAAPAMTIGIDTSAPAMTTHIESPPAAGSETGKPAPRASKDPLHGITLETIVKALVERYGWAELGEQIAIRCFTHDPSVKSSLTFLRKTPWARKKVEELYLYGGE